MDRAYKSILLSCVKEKMRTDFPEFVRVSVPKGAPNADIFSGALLYRTDLELCSRSVWLEWMPGPGSERYFNVYLGWSSGEEDLPHPREGETRPPIMRMPSSDVSGACLDLEAIEGKNAIGGLVIPSPWDQVNQLKPSVSASVQREVMNKAFAEAQALTDDERTAVVWRTVDDVLGRIKRVLPDFIAKVEALKRF